MRPWKEEEDEHIRDLLWLPDSIGFLALVVAGAAGEAGRLLLASAAPHNDAVVAVAEEVAAAAVAPPPPGAAAAGGRGPAIVAWAEAGTLHSTAVVPSLEPLCPFNPCTSLHVSRSVSGNLAPLHHQVIPLNTWRYVKAAS